MTGQAAGGVADQDVAEMLDAAVARSYGVVPIAVEDGELLLGMPDPSDAQALRALRVLAGRDIRAVSMSAAGIAAAQRDLYPDEPALARPPGLPTPRERPGERGRHRAAARKAGVQFVSLRPRRDGRDPVNPRAAQLLDEGFCRHFQIVAVAADNDVVVLATATPSDAAMVRVAAAMAGGGEPLVVAAAPGDVEHAITRAFSIPVSPPGERARPGRRKLGEMLLDSGLLDEDGLAQALRTQERTGDPLGEILVHSGIVEEGRLAAALAEKLTLPLVTIDPAQLDEETVALIPRELMLRHRLVPLAVEHGRLVVAMVDPLDDAALATLAEHVALQLRPVLATDTEIDRALRAITAPDHIDRAIAELELNRPDDSAHRVLSTGQRWGLIVACALVITAFVLWPLLTAVVLNAVVIAFSISFVVYRLDLVARELIRDPAPPVSSAEIAALVERELPVYTILVPLYQEATVVDHLVAAITELDYPPTRLDVKLLLESDDQSTLDALKALDLPPHFQLVVVPDSLPKTKPKACNYGLLQARGEFVVIYDAEDRPERDQLKRAIVSFAAADARTVCMQGKLNFYNPRRNLLTRWFTAEYSMWFDLVLPGLHSSGAPIPLGGTSNHFRRQALIDVGAWDPFNVAEDADIGIRLHKSGYRTEILDSTTYEEANSGLNNWTRQRSRWIKGYIQTWLVHNRHPVRLLAELGPQRFLAFQVVVGGTAVVFLLNPLYWAMTSLWTLSTSGLIASLFPGVLFFPAATALLLGNFLLVFLAALGLARRGHWDLIKYALVSPLYWGMMSVGAWKGLIQLLVKPHFWEKTTHGIDRLPLS